MKKYVITLAMLQLLAGCGRQSERDMIERQKIDSLALARHEELRGDLLWDYIISMNGHKGIKQIGIFEIVPINTEGRAVMVSSGDFPVGWREKFTMSGVPAVSLSMWTKDEKNQVAITFAKELIPQYGHRAKITPSLCGELGKSKFGFLFIVDKKEYAPSLNSADCNGLYGEIITGKTAIEVKFQVVIEGKLFRFMGKFST